MTLSGVAGAVLATDSTLATLPIAAVVFGTLVGLIPLARWMSLKGRRSGFRLGVGLGTLGAILALSGLAVDNFWLFTAGHFFIGLQQGAFQYLRFAAGELVPEKHRSRGISLVLAGGVIAAFLGPWLAFLGRSMGLKSMLGLAYAPILILYAVLVILFVLTPELSSATHVKTSNVQSAPARNLMAIMGQPVYLQSLAGSAIGYALMIFMMTATPLAMQKAGFNSGQTSWIIQWHVLGMFIPSFFTGNLIDRWGHRPILALGLLAFTIDALVAIFFQGMWSFWISLTLLGLGWNFLYTASTSRLTHTYRPVEKEKAQAAHDLVVFTVNTLVTYEAAQLLKLAGWSGLNLWILPLIAVSAVLILFPNRTEKKRSLL
ncbi:MAG: MFS transporter [Spirochaetales bacterium]|nr:MFS transporter [Spirochaetales bacterium]